MRLPERVEVSVVFFVYFVVLMFSLRPGRRVVAQRK
jgi:hypothetical protein